MPPTVRIYEALGAIGDNRIEIDGNSGKLYSSSRGKYYTITYNPEKNEIYANDNASFFAGYLGYPAIAFILKKGIIPYNKDTAEALAGIAWKDINQKNKNDFARTMVEVEKVLEIKGFTSSVVEKEINTILKNLEKLGLNKPVTKTRPPKGY